MYILTLDKIGNLRRNTTHYSLEDLHNQSVIGVSSLTLDRLYKCSNRVSNSVCSFVEFSYIAEVLNNLNYSNNLIRQNFYNIKEFLRSQYLNLESYCNIMDKVQVNKCSGVFYKTDIFIDKPLKTIKIVTNSDIISIDISKYNIKSITSYEDRIYCISRIIKLYIILLGYDLDKLCEGTNTLESLITRASA